MHCNGRWHTVYHTCISTCSLRLAYMWLCGIRREFVQATFCSNTFLLLQLASCIPVNLYNLSFLCRSHFFADPKILSVGGVNKIMRSAGVHPSHTCTYTHTVHDTHTWCTRALIGASIFISTVVLGTIILMVKIEKDDIGKDIMGNGHQSHK